MKRGQSGKKSTGGGGGGDILSNGSVPFTGMETFEDGAQFDQRIFLPEGLPNDPSFWLGESENGLYNDGTNSGNNVSIAVGASQVASFTPTGLLIANITEIADAGGVVIATRGGIIEIGDLDTNIKVDTLGTVLRLTTDPTGGIEINGIPGVTHVIDLTGISSLEVLNGLIINFG